MWLRQSCIWLHVVWKVSVTNIKLWIAHKKLSEIPTIPWDYGLKTPEQRVSRKAMNLLKYKNKNATEKWAWSSFLQMFKCFSNHNTCKSNLISWKHSCSMTHPSLEQVRNSSLILGCQQPPFSIAVWPYKRTDDHQCAKCKLSIIKIWITLKNKIIIIKEKNKISINILQHI